MLIDLSDKKMLASPKIGVGISGFLKIGNQPENVNQGEQMHSHFAFTFYFFCSATKDFQLFQSFLVIFTSSNNNSWWLISAFEGGLNFSSFHPALSF